MNKYNVLGDKIKELKLAQQKEEELLEIVNTLKRWYVLPNNSTLEVVFKDIKRPSYLEKGDLVLTHIGGSYHYSMVWKIIKDKIYLVTFTTNEFYKGNIDVEIKSRFVKGFLTCSIQVMTEAEALKNWIGTYGTVGEVNKLIRALKQYYKELFNFK